MNQPAILSSVHHKNIRVKDEPMAAAMSLRNTSVVLQEFQQLVTNYPILMTKNPETGGFVCVVALGFDEGENLFIKDGGWDALYIPLNVIRHPFMVGTQKKPDTEESEHVVFINESDPRVQQGDGEALFNERGFPTPYLEKMTSVLKTLQDGFAETNTFISKLLALDLIAPTTLKIEFTNQQQRHINGYYSIDQSKLNALSGEDIAELHALGYLQPIYTMLASFGHVQTLIEKKNRKFDGN
jgi:hypothetical protein